MPKPVVLIAGGAGFLGSFLADYYLANDYVVVAVDNLSTGSERNISHLRNNTNFRFVNHDVSKPIPTAVANGNIAIVANMASPASPPQYQRLALQTLQVGSNGVFNLLELARSKKARFFQASTSEVYGDPEVHPQPESYKGSVNCYGPRSMYDESKRFAEAMIYSHRQKYGTNTGIARFFNTYGPRMDANDGRVVSNFIVQALRTKPITIYGDGGQTRSFCFVDDLIEGIVRLIDSDVHEPINLGNPREFTIKQLAETVLELTNSKSKITHLPLPEDDPLQRQPVIDKARHSLGWEPRISLRDGLDPTIEYFRSLLG